MVFVEEIIYLKKGLCICNLDAFKSIGAHWIALFVNNNNNNNNMVIYFESVGVVHIVEEIIKVIRRKNIIRNIYRKQTYDSIMCRYFCIAFIDFMLKFKSLPDYTNLFSPKEYEKNNKIILKYFQ